MYFHPFSFLGNFRQGLESGPAVRTLAAFADEPGSVNSTRMAVNTSPHSGYRGSVPSSGLWSSQARHPCSAPKCTQTLMHKIPIYFYKRILHKFLLSLFPVTMIGVGRLNFNLGNLRHEKVKCKVKTKPERATLGPFDVQHARLHHPLQHVHTVAVLYPAVSTTSRENGG